MDLLFDLVRVVGWIGVAGGLVILAVVGVHAVWKTAERVSARLIRASSQRILHGSPKNPRGSRSSGRPARAQRAPAASRQEACSSG